MSNNLYLMTRIKYTKEQIEEAVKVSTSVAEVLRVLHKGQTGANHGAMKRRIQSFNIDTSHFKGQGWMKGMPSNVRKSPDEILVVNTKRRKAGYQLTRAMIEIGHKHQCFECGTGPSYNGKALTLHVDHIDGDWTNNVGENLRFMCPNCYSQTPTFGPKNK